MAGRLMPGTDEHSSSSRAQNDERSQPTSAASGVKKWATRLLHRGQSSIGLRHNGPSDPSTTSQARSKSFYQSDQQPVLAEPSHTNQAAPSTTTLNRAKPVPPPRTSSCLTSGTGHPRPDSSLSTGPIANHQDFVRLPPVDHHQQQQQQQQHELPVKSVRFGRQPSMPDVQQQKPPDALAEATIGLEIAANLALAFARDVRRERLAAALAGGGPSPPTLPTAAAAAAPSIELHLPSNRQEVTLSEFYQLLQIVGQTRSAPSVTAQQQQQQQHQPQLQQPPATTSSALVDGGSGPAAADATAVTTTITPTPGLNNDRLPQKQQQQQQTNKLPPGYLTARSFRQQSVPPSVNATPVSSSSSTGPRPQSSAAGVVQPLSQQSSTSSAATSSLRRQSSTNIIANSGVSGQTQLKTRSLPRPNSSAANHSSATPSCSRPTTPVPPPQVDAQCWAEILSLISKVLNVSSDPNHHLHHHPPSSAAAAEAAGARHQQSQPGNGWNDRTKRRPVSSGLVATSGSLSDSEEAYHQRRRSAAAAASNRPYDTLQTKSTSNSRPSSRAGQQQQQQYSHHSYLASLSQRLQVEQYIVKTLRHMGRTPSGAQIAAVAATDSHGHSGEGVSSFVQSWGSPERSLSSSSEQQQRGGGNNSVGLERALLRLEQRRIERQPRQFQHQHWRITPAECNALFLCKMSDDDRLSLTTAVSDDDDGEQSAGGEPQSPFRASRAAASFNCTGAVRKAGFLSVKKWLLRKKHQVELARKRGWRGYWVCLKGTTLLFYPCDSREGRHVEAAPKHLIIVDGAIMQPIPEHPQRDFIFCLSTAFGDAYLFQAPCQAELDTWVNSIHSACAAAFARHRGKTGTLHLLQEEILRLERSIESDQKLKHMAELQLSVVSESESRRQIGAQIAAWEENLERLHCEQYRLRCYMASLQHGELPNPKNLLGHVSRNTKHTLNRLGVFTVSSFHAYICARSPSLLNNLLAGRGATRRRPPIAPVLSRSNSLSSRKSQSMAAAAAAAAAANASMGHESGDKLFRVSLSDGQTATVSLKDNMTVEEFLAMACGKRGLNSAEHFVRVKKRREMDNSNHFVPHRTDLIDSYVPSHELVEICAKALYRVELSRNNVDQMWGFSVEAELVENAERQDELCVFVSRVEDRSVAMNHGIIKGDEIMVINGALVGDLDMMYIESVLQEELILSLTIRSCRAEPPDVTCLLRSTDDLIDSLVCPPPPSDQLITDDILSNLIVPAPSWHKEVQHQQMQSPSIGNDSPGAFPTVLPSLIQQKQSPLEMNPPPVLRPRMSERSSTSTVSDIRRSSPTGSIASSQSVAATPSRQLSDGEKLKKCILELVETERTYVKHLNSLLENYLEPLKQETFLSSTEINALFGNIQEIVAFQRLFQQSLEEAMAVEPNFEQLDHPSQFQNLLFAIGSAFLHHANHFKLYSSFCASHSKAQKVLLPNEGSQALQEFLQSRNPRQQHSSTLESYLIKPIQRILKYPLLLQQLRNLTDSNSSEHQHLIDALKGMEKVAEHINEMQRIHEEYGAIFDHLFRQHQKSCKQPVDLSPSELLYYGGVEWLNISDFLGKVKKGLELHAMCFVFKSAVVFLCKERLRQRKKLMSVTTKSTAPEVEIIRYQVLIPVTEVQVRTAQTKDMESHYLWELIHLKNPLHRRSEKVYQLSNSTAEFRNAFLKTIRQIIRESVRNMSIPPAKPPMAPSSSTGSTPPTSKSDSVSKGSSGSKRNAQRHSTGAIDYDNVEACASGAAAANEADETNEDDKPVIPSTFRGRSQTFGENKKVRRVDSMEARDGDPGDKSENEEDALGGKSGRLGRTPNHLSLSTTSTLSTGSLASQARLIQASRTPQTYTPAVVKPLGSPIWKPRDGGGFGESFTLPRPSKSTDMPGASGGAATKNSYGTLGFPSKK